MYIDPGWLHEQSLVNFLVERLEVLLHVVGSARAVGASGFVKVSTRRVNLYNNLQIMLGRETRKGSSRLRKCLKAKDRKTFDGIVTVLANASKQGVPLYFVPSSGDSPRVLAMTSFIFFLLLMEYS